jgi:hypothetical protein
MIHLKTFEAKSNERGDDYIVDIVNLIKAMSKYKLVSTDDIEIESKKDKEFDYSIGRIVDSVELLIYVRYTKKSRYTIWVRNSSVMIYWPGNRDTVAIFGYDYITISDEKAYENCMSIVRKNTLEINRTKGIIGEKGDIEYLIPDFKASKKKEEKAKKESEKKLKELKPETIEMLRKMFKDAGF